MDNPSSGYYTERMNLDRPEKNLSRMDPLRVRIRNLCVARTTLFEDLRRESNKQCPVQAVKHLRTFSTYI